MFFLKTLTRELLLHPQFLGPSIEHVIRQKMIDEVEGTSLGKDGWCVCVLGIRPEDIGDGKISEEEIGMVSFHIKYTAILFRPFKNEVLDVIVQVATEVCFVSCFQTNN